MYISRLPSSAAPRGHARPHGRYPISPTLRFRKPTAAVQVPEIEQSLLATTEGGPGAPGLESSMQSQSSMNQTHHADAGNALGGREDDAGRESWEEEWVEWWWLWRDFLPQLAGVLVLVWPATLPSLLSAPLLAGALHLLSTSPSCSHTSATPCRGMLALAAHATVSLAAQAALQVLVCATACHAVRVLRLVAAADQFTNNVSAHAGGRVRSPRL